MIINKNNILHIQEPEHNDQLVWIDIYMESGILRLGFTYYKSIEKLVMAKANDFYQELDREMGDSHTFFTVDNLLIDFIRFINFHQVEDFVIKSSTKNSK
jgi:hypothetical protein